MKSRFDCMGSKQAFLPNPTLVLYVQKGEGPWRGSRWCYVWSGSPVAWKEPWGCQGTIVPFTIVGQCPDLEQDSSLILGGIWLVKGLGLDEKCLSWKDKRPDSGKTKEGAKSHCSIETSWLLPLGWEAQTAGFIRGLCTGPSHVSYCTVYCLPPGGLPSRRLCCPVSGKSSSYLTHTSAFPSPTLF